MGMICGKQSACSMNKLETHGKQFGIVVGYTFFSHRDSLTNHWHNIYYSFGNNNLVSLHMTNLYFNDL